MKKVHKLKEHKITCIKRDLVYPCNCFYFVEMQETFIHKANHAGLTFSCVSDFVPFACKYPTIRWPFIALHLQPHQQRNSSGTTHRDDDNVVLLLPQGICAPKQTISRFARRAIHRIASCAYRTPLAASSRSRQLTYL